MNLSAFQEMQNDQLVQCRGRSRSQAEQLRGLFEGVVAQQKRLCDRQQEMRAKVEEFHVCFLQVRAVLKLMKNNFF